MWKSLYLLVFIVAGSSEEACAEGQRCCAVLLPIPSVMDEAPGSAGLGAGIMRVAGDGEGEWGCGCCGRGGDPPPAMVQLLHWGCAKPLREAEACWAREGRSSLRRLGPVAWPLLGQARPQRGCGWNRWSLLWSLGKETWMGAWALRMWGLR